ncbi:MAG: SAM-dependent methyltransferase [Proteobacteria bacterium]|nr:MAG: SAM-dependent methyltransferase [Pseudomonadota bacterium]
MVAPAKRKQDEFQAFYTNCDYIASYMTGLLECKTEMSVLEPCAGEGVFIDEVMNNCRKCNITAYELNEDSANNLTKKYSSYRNINILNDDFLLLISGNKYDRVIANPPYGAYQTPEKRKRLKKDYPDFYTKETYGLFLIRAMELLKPNGRLVFIIPDTYLTLHMHEGLRKSLLKHYTIESITLFPSNFFPGINFGYAGLSIISVSNKKPSSNHSFSVFNGLHSQAELPFLLTNKKKEYEVCRLSYSQLINNPANAFFLPTKGWISKVLQSKTKTIGDICSVVTGFYSGNDGEYLRRLPTVNRGVKKYSAVKAIEICNSDLSKTPPLEGIDREQHWVPIVKGGNRRFYKPSEWFMDWSKEAVYNYKVTNKKRARFQNSQYYFRQGIAVPMVSSSSITGSLIDKRLFDQSIVGIFPSDNYKYLTYYLLGFFNSNACNNLIRTINASTNNSANYIKKLPIIIPKKRLVEEISSKVKRLVSNAKTKEVTKTQLRELDDYYNKVYSVANE